MRIIDLKIAKEELADAQIGIVCRFTFEDGTEMECCNVWAPTTPRAVWPLSEGDARDPDEVATFLELFARAIRKSANEKEAA